MKDTQLLRTDRYIRVNSGDLLSIALSRLSSSHDAAFVFNEKGEYVGVVNPYYSIIKKSYPSNAKVEHCIFNAPHISIGDSVERIARQMVDSKVHYLPVFDTSNTFVGTVSARSLLELIKSTGTFNIPVETLRKMKKRHLVTIQETDTIASALALFKSTKVSKLVVISKEGKLKGILSYYDLVSFLAVPKKKDKADKTGEGATSLHTKSVRQFAKTYVLTIKPDESAYQVASLILEKKIGSVVVVGKDNKPQDIITTKDLMQLLISKNKSDVIELTSKNLSLKSRLIVGGFFDRMSERIMRRGMMEKVKLLVKEEKQGGLFRVVLSLFPKKGTPKIIAKEGKNLEEVLQHVKKNEK